ncbi:hypothetical protein BDZ89DRAFT_1006914 [Hymenopellis radicata]|nr:hypothetical protein BDZ89DRAFT_1006914 [Hymenopellis radicata]
MSFFGFEENDLEKEKQRFLHGPVQNTEHLAEYTWGEESYDGLGDSLQETADDLNDETFGTTGAVGKDFDFSATSQQQLKRSPNQLEPLEDRNAFPESTFSPQPQPGSKSAQVQSLESLWDDKSPFSVLPRSTPSRSPSHYASSYAQHAAPSRPITQGVNRAGVRTASDIEAEMRAAAQRERDLALQRQLLLQQQHQQEAEYLLRQQEQELLRREREREQEYRQEQEVQRQRYLYQQQQAQRQEELQQRELRQELLRQRELQQREYQQTRTPPPRMLPVSQSPRFLEHQRQAQLLQYQQERQQALRLQELQDQIRMENLERQMHAQQISNPHQRQLSSHTLAEIQAAQFEQRRQRSQSPAGRLPLGEGLHYMPQNVQLQNRMLSDLMQTELLLQNSNPAEQEALRAEAMRKILEAEKLEEKRRRRAAKIAHMSRYNDLMTQSDKDFITRIQVSQLVTQDPYSDDFYAQAYGAIMRSRMGIPTQDERVLKFGSGGGIGLGVAPKGAHRRQSAMQKMEQQVERIVSNARRREEEKGLHSLHSLQGALGKTSGRSYKAAPRQLLQVDSNGSSTSPSLAHAHAHISKQDSTDMSAQPAEGGAAAEAAKLGRQALGNAADATDLVRKDPLTKKEILACLEELHDLVLRVEQHKQDEPTSEEPEMHAQWETEYSALVEQMWTLLKVMVPVATSDPHPFVALLSATKGKRVLPRLARQFDSQQLLTILTLLIACFSQLDVIRLAPILDTLEDTRERAEVERQTQAFLTSVMQVIVSVVSNGSLRLVTGLLGLLLDRNDIAAIAQTEAGLVVITTLLARVEVIKQSLNTLPEEEMPTADDANQWQLMYDHMFELLTPVFPFLFPSTRMVRRGYQLPHSNAVIDNLDRPVWQFLATFALHALPDQQPILVQSLREKVLENVVSAKKGWVADEEERQAKLANVDLFLSALGLSSALIDL